MACKRTPDPIKPCKQNDCQNFFNRKIIQFSFNCFNYIASDPKESYAFSPISVQILLATLSICAHGKSQEEINKVLNVFNTKDLRLLFKNVCASLPEITNKDIVLANRIFIQDKGCDVNNLCSYVLDDIFSTEIIKVDFGNTAEASATINQWVDEITTGRIQNAISENSIDPAMALFVVNVIYLKVKWAVPFDVNKSRLKPFYIDDDEDQNTSQHNLYSEAAQNIMPISSSQVKTSDNEEDVSLSEDEDSQRPSIKLLTMCSDTIQLKINVNKDQYALCLEIPFKDSDLIMLIFMPDRDSSLDDLANKLAKINDFTDIRKTLTTERAIIELPKFTFNMDLDLKDVLINLGVQRIFAPELAELNLLESNLDSLFVTNVKQRVFLDVSEEGVEVAAATTAVITYRSMPRIVKINRPFIFMLVNAVNIPLYVGRFKRTPPPPPALPQLVKSTENNNEKQDKKKK